jgi:hypothetical protein
LSKIDDYLADNLCVSMLSEVMCWIQEESGRRCGLVPELGMLGGKAPPKRSLDGPPSGRSGRDSLGHPPKMASKLPGFDDELMAGSFSNEEFRARLTA